MSEENKNPMTGIDFEISKKIHIIRGVQVMLDSDLADLYSVSTSNLNKAVKRNKERFPKEFCFIISEAEFNSLKFQNGISNGKGGRRYCPYVFTEQGVSMLAGILRSETAVKISISIIKAFVSMRHYLSDNAMVFQRLDRIELKQIEADDKFNLLFKHLENPKPDKAIVFFKGQMWDATNCIEEIISKAAESIILIDNYVDRNTLDILSRKKPKTSVSLYTAERYLRLSNKEINDFKSQYGPLSIHFTEDFHDRFLILDKKEFYHIGASIKDAGKKAFEISKNEDGIILRSILERL